MNTRLALVAALTAACLVGAVAAPAAAQSGPAVGFGDYQTTVTQGDVATVDVQLRNTEAASLRVRSADQHYSATLRVRDGNGDGTVRVRLNTLRAAGDEPEPGFTPADDADEVELVSSSREDTGDVLDTGRYNLIVSTAETSVASVLRVEASAEPGGSSTSVVAPGASLPAADTAANRTGDADDAAATDDGTGTAADDDVPTAAAGDQLRTRFAVPGLGGVVASDPPARNLVYPTDSAPTARTVHAMATSPDESIGVRSMTIDYGVDDGVPPADVHQLSRDDIETLGVDTTGDGYVDRSAQIAVQNLRTSTDGRVTVTFDRPIEVGTNDTLLASYAVRNPDANGSQDVTVTLHGEGVTHYERGTVLYGPAGQGTLGYGVDLRIESVEREAAPTAPLAPLDVAYDEAAGHLVADADTDALAPGRYVV
ncbi:hypothetical protein GJ633_15480, partial [Halorubrum sp. CBA1125]|uniref:DUF7827 domain-containing protein n=1 Tax=Halorubrum sp. CBA1125 TaxID=2668072 RepID=UPI0012E8546F